MSDPSSSAHDPNALDPWTILDALPDYLAVLDAGGTIRYLNAASRRLFGADGGLHTGASYLAGFETLFAASDIDVMTVQAGLREIVAGERDRMEIEFPYDADGQRRWFAATALPYALADERGTLVQHREITRRRQVEAQLHESEAELRALFAAMTDMIFVIDARGRYLKIGPTSSALLSDGVATLIGKTFHELLPAAQADAFLDCIQRALETRQTTSIRYSITVNQAEQWFAAAISPLQADRVLWVARDITESKQTEEAIKQLKQWQDLLLNSAGEGIFGLDLNGNTTFINPAAARMVGWAPEELIGRPQHALIHHTRPDGSPYPRQECPIYAAFTDGAVHRVDSEVFWRKDGSSFPIEYISTPLREEDALIGAVVTFKDITERRQIEEEQRRQEEIIRQQASALMELSTPLIPISDHTLLLPLVGALDSRRAQQVMEMLLQGIAEHTAESVILDITGVPLVDTHVAGMLMRAAQAVRLLGARVLLTGIRPEVAQAIVGLGVDLSSIETRASLQDGIAATLGQVRVSPRSGPATRF